MVEPFAEAEELSGSATACCPCRFISLSACPTCFGRLGGSYSCKPCILTTVFRTATSKSPDKSLTLARIFPW